MSNPSKSLWGFTILDRPRDPPCPRGTQGNKQMKPEFEINQPSDFKPESFLEYTKLKADGGLKQDSFKPDHLEYMQFYEESNEKWLKSSIATFNGKGPDISYEAVDTSLIQPRPRKYD